MNCQLIMRTPFASIFLSSFLLLSSAIGYSSPTDGGRSSQNIFENERDGFPYDLTGHAPGHQQKAEQYFLHKEMDPRQQGVNETLWAAVVDAATRTPFDWIQLSHALNALEEDFQKRLSGTSRDSPEKNAEHGESRATASSSSKKSLRPTFTYHRVLTFLRNGSRPGQTLSAIAAVSASATRPPSPASPPTTLHHDQLDLKSRTTSSLITSPLSHHLATAPVPAKTSLPFSLQEEILSRLLEEHTGNNRSENDYGRHLGRRDRVPLSSSSRRHFQEKWHKLSDHSNDEDDQLAPPKTLSNFDDHQQRRNYHHPFKYIASSVHHQKRHEPVH